MVKKVIILLLLLAVGLGIYLTLPAKEATTPEPQTPRFSDPLDGTYTIEGEPITFVDGFSETEAAPGSAMKNQIKVFGEPTTGDIDKDGDLDAILMFFENPGGTGTFYYVTAAVNTSGTYQGTNSIFLGDRIAPQTVEIRDGQIIVNYADRKPDEPMVTSPSVGVTIYLVLNGSILETVEPNMDRLVE